MASESGKKRLLHYDLLRILAAFSVVMLHSAAQFWYTIPFTEAEWKIANCYDGLFRFGVPIFVMISGALFLEREIDIKRLYKHNILRMVIVFLVWSAVYGIYDCRILDLQEIGLIGVIREIMWGRYHLWFLQMLVGIYILLPILQSWVKHTEQKNIRYFLMVFLVLRIGKETLSAVQQNEFVTYVLDFTDVSELYMVCSYIGYFVLGYYIAHYGIPKKWHKWIYGAAIPSAILNVVLDTYLTMERNALQGILYDSFGLFTFIVVVALFLFFTDKMSKVHYSDKASRLIEEVSGNTFGIYVMHLLCMEILESVGFNSMTVPNIIGIPLLALVVFVICMICAAILRRIPFVGKYIC